MLIVFIINLILIRIFKIFFYHDVVSRIAQGCVDYEVGVVTLILIDTILRDTRPSLEGAYRARTTSSNYVLLAIR